MREARVHEAAREDAIALRRYNEALALDPTCEPAYLGLGALRLKLGDAREAERVYSVALEHVPSMRPALKGRARARWALGRHADAERDMESYGSLEADVLALKELAAWYGEDGRQPAQLATWRRVVGLAEKGGDALLVREARTMVKALQILVGPADPACAPSDGDPVRRGLAAIAKRGG